MFKKVTIYVVRVGSDNEIRDSAPCMYCSNQLKEYNIKRIVYSNTQGNYTAKKCRDYQTDHVSHGEKMRRAKPPLI